MQQFLLQSHKNGSPDANALLLTEHCSTFCGESMAQEKIIVCGTFNPMFYYGCGSFMYMQVYTPGVCVCGLCAIGFTLYLKEKDVFLVWFFFVLFRDYLCKVLGNGWMCMLCTLYEMLWRSGFFIYFWYFLHVIKIGWYSFLVPVYRKHLFINITVEQSTKGDCKSWGYNDEMRIYIVIAGWVHRFETLGKQILWENLFH